MGKYQFLSDEFLAKYPDFPAHMNEIGKFVFIRTYSRWIPELKRRETWKETCARAVDYNMSLAPIPPSREEAEKFFDNMFNLRQFLAGRTLWVGGTEAARKYPMSNFNCSFVVIDDFDVFYDLTYLLMIGTGVGFRILKEDVEKLPRIRQGIPLVIEPYKPLPKHQRQEYTSLEFTGNIATIRVGDSKEGWASAIDYFFRLLYRHEFRNIEGIVMNFDSVRPKGERLKTFGGTASGPEAFMTVFKKIDDVINSDRFAPRPVNGKLRPIHILDICNIIGEGIVVGGVRRTSEIALIDEDDKETILAKKDLWKYPDKQHRFMSNNSIYYRKKPSWEQIEWQFSVLENEGEPCFLNAEAASKRRPNFKGVNPCVEILLDSYGLCNLTTINVMAFVKDGKLDLEGLLEAQRMSARAGYRMTCVDLELDKWDRIQKRDRLLGCSVTGWKDAMEALGYTKEQEQELQRMMHKVAREAADEYADFLGLNRPLLVTAVKPEGTISQLAGGVSSGLHHTHAPYFIRRIRINAHDPLVKVAEELGWRVHNEVGQGVPVLDEEGNPVLEEYEDEHGIVHVREKLTPVNTKVIDFPVHAPVKRTKYEVSAIEQLETYLSFQRNYTEHNASNTISVKDHEWEDVKKFVYEHWDEIVAVSFLKLDGHTYDLAPFESITREEYEKLKSEMKQFDEKLLTKYETGDDFDLGNESCEGGACPIR